MADSRSLFRDRRMLIVTKHSKEQVLGPLFQEGLGVIPIPSEGFDTDLFGTFTGEVKRQGDPFSTLRKKCLIGMEQFGFDLGLASEGSFGPHPSIGFIPADHELVVLIDKKYNLEISARELSMKTNFMAKQIDSIDDLRTFAIKAKFPSHALIISMDNHMRENIQKGINDWLALESAFISLSKRTGKIWVETDMRAMHNPTRMGVIKKVGQKLLDRVNSLCPSCAMPGFGIVEARFGLPCGACGAATESVLSHVYKCTSCSQSEEYLFPNKRSVEDPMYCNFCNP